MGRWDLCLHAFFETIPYVQLFRNGCDGFAKKLLGWPDSLILGGIERNEVCGDG